LLAFFLLPLNTSFDLYFSFLFSSFQTSAFNMFFEQCLQFLSILFLLASTSGDGVNSMDTTSSNSAPLAVEFSSPFYLLHGESPGTLLVSQPLVGNNYHT
jgi:hypothetical protein